MKLSGMRDGAKKSVTVLEILGRLRPMPGASVCLENALMYSAGNEAVGFSLKPLRCRDPALPPLYGHTYSRPFFLQKARMRSLPVHLALHREGLFLKDKEYIAGSALPQTKHTDAASPRTDRGVQLHREVWPKTAHYWLDRYVVCAESFAL